MEIFERYGKSDLAPRFRSERCVYARLMHNGNKLEIDRNGLVPVLQLAIHLYIVFLTVVYMSVVLTKTKKKKKFRDPIVVEKFQFRNPDSDIRAGARRIVRMI